MTDTCDADRLRSRLALQSECVGRLRGYGVSTKLSSRVVDAGIHAVENSAYRNASSQGTQRRYLTKEARAAMHAACGSLLASIALAVFIRVNAALIVDWWVKREAS